MINVLALQSMSAAHDDAVITGISSLGSAVCCNGNETNK
ncbi:class III lanthipeptide [Shewanella algae]